MRLDESASATANAAGKATARLQVLRAFERWHITNVSIRNTSTVNVPKFTLYRGSEAPSNQIDTTLFGTLNSDSDANIWLENGEALLAVWENGDSGSVGTFTIGGTREKS